MKKAEEKIGRSNERQHEIIIVRRCVAAWYRGMAAKQSYFPMKK